MRFFLGVIILVMCLPWGYAADIGFKDVLQKALEKQIDYLQAKTELMSAEEVFRQKRSSFLPSLSLESSFNRNWLSANPETDSLSSDAKIVSRWSLYDNGTSFRNYSIADYNLKAAGLRLTLAKDSVAAELLKKFSAYRLLVRRKQIGEQKLKLLSGQYSITRRQFKQGLKPSKDYQRLKAEVERAKLEILQLNDLIQDTLEEVSAFVSGDLIVRPEDGLLLLPMRKMIEQLQNQIPIDASRIKVDEAPAYKALQLTYEAKKLETTEARTGLWPQLNLLGSVGYGSNSFVKSNERWSDQEQWFASGQLLATWTLFDWGGNTSQARAASYAEAYHGAQVDQLRANLNFERSQLLRQVARQKKTLGLVEEILKIEAGTFKDIESEYKQGRGSYLDLISSLERKVQAELNLEQELNAYLLALLKLLQQKGGLYEALVSSTN